MVMNNFGKKNLMQPMEGSTCTHNSSIFSLGGMGEFVFVKNMSKYVTNVFPYHQPMPKMVTNNFGNKIAFNQ
jgi:hypothetical protein